MNKNEGEEIIITKIYKKRKSRKRFKKFRNNMSDTTDCNNSIEIIEEKLSKQPINKFVDNDTSIEIISEHIVSDKNIQKKIEIKKNITEITIGESTDDVLSNQGSHKNKNTSNHKETCQGSPSNSSNDNLVELIKTDQIQEHSMGEVDDAQRLTHSKKDYLIDRCPSNNGPRESKYAREDFISLNSNSENKTNSTEMNDLFQIDTAPSAREDVVPRYLTKFSETALLGEKNNCSKKCSRNVATCFNCLGEHSLRDCDKRRDNMAINRNRNMFMMKKAQQMGNVTASRYHLDHNQRFAHIKPGSISKRLRKALNLKQDQLPLHIYKMRLLGYPPAWLEEAKVDHSGICVFDSSGQATADPEDEDGEVDVDLDNRCKYDIKKVIEYPGFNVKPPKGTLNESDYLGYPEMSHEQSTRNLISFLTPLAIQPYKKRKFVDKDLKDSASPIEDEGDSQDMEVEDIPEETKFEPVAGCSFIPALPDEPLPPPPPPPPPSPPEEEGEIRDEDEEKPKEDDKGTKRKHNDEETSGEKEAKKKKSNSFPLQSSSSSPTLRTPPESTNLIKHSSVPNLGSVKQLEVGTPIISHYVSMEKLPSQESFSKNISDVINFENLPDSTGTYKVINKVIKKVRKFMKKITKS